ncbi:MAG: aminoacyl-tRNA hydrolase [Oscillospiraceae bacterium]|nr:aminoacyl-tRNA hydrolase [Oscillospiraceae bacterium]
MLFSSRPPAWLVVFLGNPGLKYEGTRHNAGFMVADALSVKKDLRIDRARFRSLTATCRFGDVSALLMKPQTYMNLSGEAVSQAARFYKIPPERILVVSDEVSLPVGSLRVRPRGSAGGHNGLKSIITLLGSEEFPRIRLGVGSPPHPDYAMPDWVLSAFHDEDALEIRKAAGLAADAVDCCITHGIEKAMNLYNRKPGREKTETVSVKAP